MSNIYIKKGEKIISNLTFYNYATKCYSPATIRAADDANREIPIDNLAAAPSTVRAPNTTLRNRRLFPSLRVDLVDSEHLKRVKTFFSRFENSQTKKAFAHFYFRRRTLVATGKVPKPPTLRSIRVDSSRTLEIRR